MSNDFPFVILLFIYILKIIFTGLIFTFAYLNSDFKISLFVISLSLSFIIFELIVKFKVTKGRINIKVANNYYIYYTLVLESLIVKLFNIIYSGSAIIDLTFYLSLYTLFAVLEGLIIEIVDITDPEMGPENTKKNYVCSEVFYIFEVIVFFAFNVSIAAITYDKTDIEYITIVIINVATIFSLSFKPFSLIINLITLYLNTAIYTSILTEEYWSLIWSALLLSFIVPIFLFLFSYFITRLFDCEIFRKFYTLDYYYKMSF